jgi:hypothetical protein
MEEILWRKECKGEGREGGEGGFKEKEEELQTEVFG